MNVIPYYLSTEYHGIPFILVLILALLAYLWRCTRIACTENLENQSVPPKNMEEYLENLLKSPTTRKKLLKYDFFCSIYKVSLPNKDKIMVKKAKPLSPVFHILLNFLQCIFWSAVKKNTRNSHVRDSIEGASNARLYLEICHHKTRCLGLHILVSNAIQSYMDGTMERERMQPDKQIEFVLAVARTVGYLHSKKIPMLDLNWENRSFLGNLYEIGSALPYQMFWITLTLRKQDGPMIVEVDVKGLIGSVPHKAQYHISSARIRATSRLRVVSSLVVQHLKSFANVDFDTEWPEIPDMASSKSDLTPNSGAVSPLYDTTDDSQQTGLVSIMEHKANLFEQDQNACSTLITILSCIGQRSIQLALKDPTVSIASAFIKKIDKRGMVDIWEALAAKVLAAKNGITTEITDANPGLREFLEANHLHRYLFVFGHELRVNKETLECSIMYQGEWVSWKIILSNIHMDPDTWIIKGRYSRHGLINRGVYDWQKLEPFDITECTWGNRYLLEINSWIMDTARMSGDHTWLRLKTPKGEWYSVGLYPPRKMSFHEQLLFPMKIKPSKLMSPDSSEFWRGSYRVLAFEITESQFKIIKKQIEHDHKNREYTYQLFHGNCTRYAISIAELAGIELPASIPLIKVFVTSERIHTFARQVLNSRYTPRWVRPFLVTSWTVFFNITGLLFGSGIVDKEIKYDPIYRDVRPFINDLYDIMDSEKVITHHPFIIGHFVRNDILAWREEQTLPLNKEVQICFERLGRLKLEGKETLLNDIEEADTLKQRIKDLEMRLQSTEYVCPPKYRKHNSGSSFKVNCWVGKSRITEADIEIEDDMSTDTMITSTSTNSF